MQAATSVALQVQAASEAAMSSKKRKEPTLFNPDSTPAKVKLTGHGTEMESDCVTFLVGTEGLPFLARKSILTSQSRVFRAMFEGSLPELGSEVTVPDIEHGTFAAMMQYMEERSSKVTTDNVFDLMYAAQKYEVLSFIAHLTSFIEDRMLLPHKAIEVMEHAHLYNIKDLHRRARDVILRHGTQALSEQASLELLCRDCLHSIVTSEQLVVSEIQVWEALTLWAESRCDMEGLTPTGANMRRILGDLIYSVRFLHILPEHLARLVTPSDILTTEEKVAILEGAVLSKTKHGAFSGQPREWEVKPLHKSDPDDVLCACVRLPFASGLMPSYWINDVTFWCSKPVRLCGFALYGPHSRKMSRYHVRCMLVDRQGQVRAEKGLQLDGSERLLSVFFEQAIFVGAGLEHTLCVTAQGPPTFRGEGGRDMLNYGGNVFRFTENPSPAASARLDAWFNTFPFKVITRSQPAIYTGQIPELFFSQVKDA